MSKLLRRVAIPGAAAAMIATSGFAFMANNSVDNSFAGTGNQVVSGYHVSDIHYTTADNWPGGQYIKSVSFHLNHPASADNVNAYLWYDYSQNPARFSNCTADNGQTTGVNFTCHPYTSGQKSVTAKSLVKIVVSATS